MRICHVRRQANDLSSDSNGRLILARCGECRPDGVITVELLSQRLVPRTLWGLPLRLCKRLAEAHHTVATPEKDSMSYPAEHRNLTKQKIVRSARRLFNRRGFDTVSIDDVMADAGLTRGSFYSYFESKGDLYAEAVTQILEEKQLLSSDGVSIDPRAVDS